MITSLTNARVKYVRRLQQDRRFREREAMFVVEGTRWLSDVLTADLPCQHLFVTPAWLESAENEAILQQLSHPFQEVTDEVMAAMSDTQTPQGVLAVLAMQPRPFPPQPHLLLILDAITNPGNLGTMLRTAAAAGTSGVLLGPGCVDLYNPKVVRGSMGALLRIPVHSASWAEIASITSGMAVWVAAASGAQAYTAVNWKRPSALIIGNEGSGASPNAFALAQGTVAIPMHTATESLNAAIAAAIILFEANRQQKTA